jgi:hypothetical protein
MLPLPRYGAPRTGSAGLRRAYQEDDLRHSGVNVTGGEAQHGDVGEDVGKDVGC